MSANLDPREIDKFSALAAGWWDRDGDSRTLHDINPCRVAFVADRATLVGTPLLDVGCGGGVLAEALAVRGARVVGVDASAALIEAARWHVAPLDLTLTYEVGTIEQYAGAHPGEFAVVTCMELLEHVPDPPLLLSACRQALRAGGDLFLSTLNRTPKAYVAAVAGAEHLLGLLPVGTHDYARFIRPSELARWLRQADFQVMEIRGLHYNPLLRQARLSEDTRVNYLVHARAGEA